MSLSGAPLGSGWPFLATYCLAKKSRSALVDLVRHFTGTCSCSEIESDSSCGCRNCSASGEELASSEEEGAGGFCPGASFSAAAAGGGAFFVFWE